MVFGPCLIVPAGTAYRPVPPPPGAAPGAGGVKGTDRPLTHTSALFRTCPNDMDAASALPFQSTVRVNQRTPSKSGSPRVSHAPGTWMSFQAAARSAAAGVRQSGFRLPMRSGTGRSANGTADLSDLYAARKSP